jgi:hypothetical protein
MSNRVQKRPKRDITRERKILAAGVDLFGVPADMPCTRCFKRKKECVFGPDGKSSRCSECVSAGKPCDGVLVASSCSFGPVPCSFSVS